MRETDRAVHARTGLTPLSVSTDRIAHPALRWAGIEARLREEGIDVARDGNGRICEVYPAAALRRWGLPHRGYKGTGGRAARRGLVEALGGRFPGLEWAGHDAACVEVDDVLDAVIAALMAGEVARGRAVPPPDPLRIRPWKGPPGRSRCASRPSPPGPSAPPASESPPRPGCAGPPPATSRRTG